MLDIFFGLKEAILSNTSEASLERTDPARQMEQL